MFYGFGFWNDGFIVLDVEFNPTFSMHISIDKSNDDVEKWHSRLGHVGQQRMTRLTKEDLMGSLSKIELPTCKFCLAGKTAWKPFGKATRVEYPLQLIHSDLYGPLNVRTRHGASYFITFIDDFTLFGDVFLISHKFEALSCFRNYANLVEN